MNRSNPWMSAALVAGTVVVQTSLLDKLSIHGVKPDLVLILAVSGGLLWGWQAGAAYGVAAGFLQDLLVGRYIGLHALTHGLLGGVAGAFERSIFKENPIVPLLGCLLGSLLHGVLMFGLLAALGRGGPFGQAWGAVILPASVYNAALGPFVYWAISKWLPSSPEPSGRNPR